MLCLMQGEIQNIMKILKTNTDNIAKPAVSLILIGVLKGYIKNPIGFILKSKLTFRKYRHDICIDLPGDFIEVIRVSVLTSGFVIQQANFRNVEENRNFENLIKYQQRANSEGSTSLNTMEIVEQSNVKYEFHVTRCVFYELFRYLKVPELTSVFCTIDNAIFNTYLPEKLIFHRNGLNNTIPQGNEYCKFVIEKKEKEYTGI